MLRNFRGWHGRPTGSQAVPFTRELQQAARAGQVQFATALPGLGESVGCFQYRVLQLRLLFLYLQCSRWALRDGFTNLCLRRCTCINYKLSVFHLEHRRGTFHTFSGVNTGISVICYFHRKFPPSYFWTNLTVCGRDFLSSYSSLKRHTFVTRSTTRNEIRGH